MANYGMSISGGKLVYTDPSGSTGTAPALTMLAADYSATSTYSKGDLCTYNGKLYAAKQDIGTAETWKASHWLETTIGAAIAGKADKV